MGRCPGRQLQPGRRGAHRVGAGLDPRRPAERVDVNTFTSWLAALGADERAGVVSGLTEDGYTPQPGTESAFLYERFRPEFRVAFDVWLATGPRTNPTAPPTPFAMPEYPVAEAEQAAALEQQAEELSAVARQANQRGDNYVLMTIMFAPSSCWSGSARRWTP